MLWERNESRLVNKQKNKFYLHLVSLTPNIVLATLPIARRVYEVFGQYMIFTKLS